WPSNPGRPTRRRIECAATPSGWCARAVVGPHVDEHGPGGRHAAERRWTAPAGEVGRPGIDLVRGRRPGAVRARLVRRHLVRRFEWDLLDDPSEGICGSTQVRAG